MSSHSHIRRRRNQRREDALRRQAAYDHLTLQQRLGILDERLGPGVGARRERARLIAQLVVDSNRDTR